MIFTTKRTTIISYHNSLLHFKPWAKKDPIGTPKKNIKKDQENRLLA